MKEKMSNNRRKTVSEKTRRRYASVPLSRQRSIKRTPPDFPKGVHSYNVQTAPYFLNASSIRSQSVFNTLIRA